MRPDGLAAHVVAALAAQLPSVDWAATDDVVFGCANQAGEDNRNVARMAVLLAGLSVEVPGRARRARAQDRLAAGMVTVEMSRGDGSINTFIGVQSGLTMGSIELLGSKEQKQQRWLPGMAALDLVGAFALTEPEHGSDSVRLESSARRDGDHWVLDEAKRWIGNAGFADVVVWARDVEDGWVTAYVVEKDATGAHPVGYETTLITGKIGKRAVWQPDLTLSGVRVPLEYRLGGRQLRPRRQPGAHRHLRGRRLGVARTRPCRLRDRPGLRELNHAQKARRVCLDAGDILGRQRAAHRAPHRPVPHRHGGRAHLPGHRQHPGPHRGARHHRDLRLRLSPAARHSCRLKRCTLPCGSDTGTAR